VAVGLLLTAAGFNAAVDPFGMLGWVELEGWNAHKPAIYHRVRLFKAYDVRRLRPQAIVLGTSRSHLGLRPSHPGFDPRARRRYNLAFDGATTREMYHYLLHAHAVNPLRQVVLGLDTYHPTRAPGSVRPDFDARLLRVPGSLASRMRVAAADLRLLVSVDALRESLATLRAQGGAPSEWFAGDGQRLGEVFFRRPGEMFRDDGPRAYFEEIDRMEVGFKLEGMAPAQAVAPAPAGPPTPPEETSLGYIARIVAFCRANGIDLRIFLTPAHAHQLEIAAAVGEWPALEQGKRDLVRLLAEDAARHPHQPPVPLYDFSGYSSITTGPLPPPGSRAEMRYYWDSSHFKEIVGDLVLDRVLGHASPERVVPADFGVQLTTGNVEEALARTREAGEAYRRRHPDEVEAIRALVDGAMRKRLGSERLARAGAG
jgi:hypothetical protein